MAEEHTTSRVCVEQSTLVSGETQTLSSDSWSSYMNISKQNARWGGVDEEGLDQGHHPRWSKPHFLYPLGCYPRCPEDKPIYDEDNMRCVTEDKCGCYVDGIHYPPNSSIPTKDICESWY